MRTPSEHRAKDGEVRWRVRYRLGKVQTSETFRRKRDAQTFAAILDNNVPDALAWLATRKAGETSGVTFGQHFEHYVDQLTAVTPRTRDDYHSMHRRYLAHLDTLPVALIARGHVTDIVNRMDRGGRAPKTIKSTINMLSSCLALAIDEGRMTSNPCKRVRLPTQQHQVEESDLFLTHEEFGMLWAAMPDRYRPLVAFLVGTGLRWSEATALEARHVDLSAGTVRVRQAWKRVRGEGFILGPPKTPKARRTVNAAVGALVAVEPLLHRPNDLVFTTRSGGPVRHANFYTNVWTGAVTRSGLQPRPKIKDLRHTHASWLISDGQSLEAVQDQLGHESILTTRKVYGHLLPALGVAVGQSASAALERALADRAQLPREILP